MAAGRGATPAAAAVKGVPHAWQYRFPSGLTAEQRAHVSGI
jgi:hypothetical protein